MDELPLVSVLMTSYNREKYIAEAIESVLSSTYSHFELIVVDDCSTDKTAEIVKQYLEKDGRIKLVINNNNLTQWPNRNKAAGYAKGSIMMWVDSDDMIKKDAIEYIVSNFQQFPEANFFSIYHKGDISKPRLVKSDQSIKQHFFKEGFLNIGPGGTAIKPAFFKQIGGFPEAYGPVGDMFFNLKAAANSAIVLMPYNYLIYRRHAGQEINNAFSYLCDGHRYLDDVLQLPEMPLSKQEKESILKKSSRNNMRSIVKYAIKTWQIGNAYRAYKISRIKLKDLL